MNMLPEFELCAGLESFQWNYLVARFRKVGRFPAPKMDFAAVACLGSDLEPSNRQIFSILPLEPVPVILARETIH